MTTKLDVSDALLDFLHGWEKCVLTPYFDARGYPTVGWGHLMQPTDDMHVTLTQDEADGLFWLDTQHASDAVNALGLTFEQYQFDALTSGVFNCGEALISAQHALGRFLRAGDYVSAATELPKWNRSRGMVLDGLIKRRAAEQRMFLFGDYAGRP